MYHDSMLAHSVIVTRPTYLCLLVLSMLLPVIAPALQAQSPGTQVIVSRAEHAEVIEEVPLTGTVISPRQARLSTEISGLVESIDVEMGDRIDEGDVILRLRSDLEQLSLQARRAETEQARRELADARRRLADAERLGRSNTVSVNEINSLKAEVAIDNAAVSRLQAEEAQQQLRLRQHTLKAPFSGVVSSRLVERGEWVQPGEAVVELVSLDDPQIEFQVPQWVYQRLDEVVRIQVRFDAIPATVFGAGILAVVPFTDRASRTFLVRTRLDADHARLIPGLSASAVMHIRNASAGVVVDRNALIRYPDGRVTVWVVNENDGRFVASEKRVETGVSFNGRINITAGLEQGETIVVNGNESLREGQTVKIKQVVE